MVQVPSTDTVNSAWEVIISGLPNTITDDELHSVLARHGQIQRLFRPAENKNLVSVTYTLLSEAEEACRDDHFNENTPCVFKISKHLSTPKHEPEQLSSTNGHGKLDCDFYDNSEVVLTQSCHQEISNGRTALCSDSRIPRDYWTGPDIVPECVAIVAFSIETKPSDEVKDFVINHSKKSGEPLKFEFYSNSTDITESQVHFKRLDEDVLKRFQHSILGKGAKILISYRPPRDPWEEPSTSKETKLRGDQLLTSFCSIHVPNSENHAEEHFRRRFESYGRILHIELIESIDNTDYAVIQFTNVDDAHRAMSDANHPKPMSYSSRPDRRLILFYLPHLTNEEIMLTIRGLSSKIDEITVDWIARNAIITFEMDDHSVQTFRKMRKREHNFGEHKVAVDYCSERLNQFILYRREENMIAWRNNNVNEPESCQYSCSAPSTSSNNEQLVEKVRRSVSPRIVFNNKQDDDFQDSNSNEDNNSVDDASSIDVSSDDDSIADIKEEKEDEEKYNANQYEHVDDRAQGPSHEYDGGQSPGNQAYDTYGYGHLINSASDEPNDEGDDQCDVIEISSESSTSNYGSPEVYSDDYRRRSPSPAYVPRARGYIPSSPVTDFPENCHRFPSDNSESPVNGSCEDGSLSPADDDGSVNEYGSPTDDNGSPGDKNRSQSNDNRSEGSDNQSQTNSRTPVDRRVSENRHGSQGYRRDDEDDDDENERKNDIKFDCAPSTSTKKHPSVEKFDDNSQFSKMLRGMIWKDPIKIASFAPRIEEIGAKNLKTRVMYEKYTGRPFPKFTNEDECRLRKTLSNDTRDYYHDNTYNELDLRLREWRKISEFVEMEELRALDSKELQRETPVLISKSSVRPSLDESRFNRFSFDSAHHPVELAQRSHSLCVGPMTPAAPYPTTTPLLVNTSNQHGSSQTSTSAVTTPRSSQPPVLMSPLSRHNSISSVGRPVSTQTHRHHSHVVHIDTTVPPPTMTPANNDVVIFPRESSTSRRSSETLVPLRSPPFVNQIPNSMVMPPSASNMAAATGTHSVSSSAHSTPRHSISGTPVHNEPTLPKNAQPQTPKSSKPEKLQVRHDSISKPGPSSAVSALQGRSQSMTVGDHKRSTPSTPAYRDAGSDLVAQIMSNQPSMGFKKLPRIEKKPSALQNVHSQQNNNHPVSTPSTPSTSHQVMLSKDKEKEKKRREREHEREREARKEMKRKETKEERSKRKQMEQTKREEDERRERKREKQRQKEKEERRRERERERKKAEKDKHKKKKNRRDDDSDDSDSASDDSSDVKKPREMTQEEKDHQLALILSKGSIIENLKSRRRKSDKRHDSTDKSNNKNQNSGTRRVLIESSDDEGEEEEDDDDEDDEDEEDDYGDEKEKSNSSSGEASEPEKRFMQPPSYSLPTPSSKEQKKKARKEREKGELSSSSDDEENKHEKEYRMKQKLNEERENRKRQKSLTTYSSDEHGERKSATKRVRREESEDLPRPNAWGLKEEQNQRKRKLAHRLSSEDESRRKAKQRDFRDIPHEDVSDEEEVEVASRIRRQSSSSTASSKETRTKKEKTGKTSLQIASPARTPLQSPKLLSPKIISPKMSSSSIKRPSISDQDPLNSPSARNRTSSSTSTATTSSKHETASIPEKSRTPPVTAKSSVSSIDEFAIREEFSSNSAVGSPMDSTGRPLVLTKAAMKAFNSSPPHKQSSSSGPRESTSGSSSTSSSSDGTSLSSSDDSSDEGTLKKADVSPVVVETETETQNVEPVKDTLVEIQPSPASAEIQSSVPFPLESGSEQTMEIEVESVSKTNEPSTFSPDPSSQDTVHEVSPFRDMQSVEESISEEKINSSEHEEEKSIVTVENEANQEPIPRGEERDPINIEIEIEPEQETEKKLEPEVMPTPIVEEPTSPKPMDVASISQEAPPSTHTIISDQETDQAVQSIFDEEEADEFPQYPDFVITKDEKETPEKSSSPKKSIEVEKSLEKANATEYPLTNGHSTNHLLSPKMSTSTADTVSERSEEPDDAMETESGDNGNDVSVEKLNETVIHLPTSPSPMKVDVENDTDQDEDGGLEIVESPEQTPTPELIPHDKTECHHEEPVPVELPLADSNKQNSVQTEERLHTPLEVSFSQQHQQVIQPSPRYATAPASEPINSEPVSVVHQSQIDKPSPIGIKNLEQDLARVADIVAGRRTEDLRCLFETCPHLMSCLPAELSQRVQDLFNYSALDPTMRMSNEIGNYHDLLVGQDQQNQPIQMPQSKQNEQKECQRRIEEENQRKKDINRKKELDPMEEKRREEHMNIVAAQKVSRKPQENVMRFENLLHLMPKEAQIVYEKQFRPFSLSLPVSEANGPVNGNHPLQQLQRPSSTASVSSSSARTPLQPSTSINLKSNESETEGRRIQRWFYSHFPMVWTGRLSLKSTETMINLHLINGSETFLNNVLGRQVTDENPRRESVKILQRLRLDNGQVDHIYGILTNPDYACCVALSSANDYNATDMVKNETNLQASFIDYLTKKQIAGVSSLEEVETRFKSARVHVFAPGEMVNKYLSELASSLNDYLIETGTRYLLIVFTNDKVEPNMDGPPSIETLAVPTLSSN